MALIPKFKVGDWVEPAQNDGTKNDYINGVVTRAHSGQDWLGSFCAYKVCWEWQPPQAHDGIWWLEPELARRSIAQPAPNDDWHRYTKLPECNV